MRQSPAEEAHDRILADIHASLRGVTYKDFLAVAKKSGTERVPQIKKTLDKLVRQYERSER